jgi:phosphate starvation-inducible PhoH-like protein
VTIFRRGEKFIVSGANAERAVELLERFYAVANKVVPIEEVQLALVEQRAGLKPARSSRRRAAPSRANPQRRGRARRGTRTTRPNWSARC